MPLILVAATLLSSCTAAADHPDSGPALEVSWGGQWWPAEIVDERCDLTKIHYVGWGNDWDEWVEPHRIRVAPQRQSTRSLRPDDPADVLWEGKWWPATILKRQGNRFYIHYDGYGQSWDEWVGLERIRGTTI
jgi:hypothetical protein